ncbi:LytTR family transcriptional regulator [Parvularcula flava]|uniref:LytTR family transcriptional regulator n=1 Tax=Aquisalinus luteolus TaxID=1566827 RepID=A0A8J3AA24_9PROT|nr:LytTR family DNA-binding domain-containing protein [Aquisalinus luteolus]NHK29102.1 LytTR family transcriptional regulator [Aquisalinus luteolus]GGI00298.1 LytTr DNA-binding domain protein [Aquisalinus luteolus]
MQLSQRNFILGAVAFSLVMGLLFSFWSVYNTDYMPFQERVFFWTSTFVVGNLATALVTPWVIDDALRDRHPALHILLIAAIVSAPVTLVLAAFQYGFNPLWSPVTWVVRYGYVIVISLTNITLGYIAFKAFGLIGPAPGEDAPESTGPAKTATERPSPAARFMDRLPVKYRGATLHAVSSEDHYLRVHTDRGEELILMRLSDALRELEDADGVQTHRGWWVSRDGVADTARENGKLCLILKSGRQAPVSRSFAKTVSEELLA